MIFYLTLLNIGLTGVNTLITSWCVSIPNIVVSVIIITLATKNLYNRYVSD
ncbi:hypothetical protein [Pelosinus sp. UFO1]|uniref:hypothetical protein n=1 Tax=Pelosinus sp. UFO1 TaxID=484770 RepID=UPI0004D0F33E|nr:hypothetical protein [Pelosinus sp. UFO1]AIF51817.1 hypothetical protein UFO1_2270 [Pelosinus sp. UFO1]